MSKLETGKQLPLETEESDETEIAKKKVKKRNKKRDRWLVATVLLVTILVSLGFYLSSGIKKQTKTDKVETGIDKKMLKEGGRKGFFGTAVYEF